jgi:hypothetical protein
VHSGGTQYSNVLYVQQFEFFREMLAASFIGFSCSPFLGSLKSQFSFSTLLKSGEIKFHQISFFHSNRKNSRVTLSQFGRKRTKTTKTTSLYCEPLNIRKKKKPLSVFRSSFFVSKHTILWFEYRLTIFYARFASFCKPQETSDAFGQRHSCMY